MKKPILLILGFLLMLPVAFADSTKHGQELLTKPVIPLGGATIQSSRKTLGASGVATQLTTASTPCISATVCASPQATDIVMVGGSNVTVANPFVYISSVSVDVGIPIGTGTTVDRCATLAVDNVNLLYGAGRASTDTVLITYVEA